MIAVEARGRLGNQMFQFAFGLAAAKRLGTTFAMATDLLREAFTLGPYGRPLGRAWRGARYRHARRAQPYPIMKVDNESYADPAEVIPKLRDRRQYAGFFQSELFFANAREEVRNAFVPRPEAKRAFQAAYGDLANGPYICCHVRRTDYVASNTSSRSLTTATAYTGSSLPTTFRLCLLGTSWRRRDLSSGRIRRCASSTTTRSSTCSC